jgi:S1-C subfamily serine protease
MRGIGVLLLGAMMLAGTVGVSEAASAFSCDRKKAASSKEKFMDKKAAAAASAEADEGVKAMAEEFGVIVGPVTEDIKKELNLRSAEGVAVFEVIGDSLADVAGIKVHAVIAEINKKPVRNLEDFGRLLCENLDLGNFTVGTWEPTTADNQGLAQQMNFHFVPKLTD